MLSCCAVMLFALRSIPSRPKPPRAGSSVMRERGHLADATRAGVRALSSSIASPNAWVGRGLAFIPVFAIILAWLSYGRIRSRGALREAERAAVFAHIGSRLIARQEGVLRAADDGRPISPSDRPS